MDTLLRWIFKFFDSIVYGLITSLYNLFIEIADLSIISNSTIQTFASRIYVLIGVFMLFKVTFSLILLLMNPDDVTDKSKGIGNITKRVMITLVLLPIVPWIFQQAFTIQRTVLENNVLANIILGGNYGNDNFDDNPGDCIAFGVLSSFLHPDEDKYANWATNDKLYEDASADDDLKEVYDKYRNAVVYKDAGMLLDLINEKDDDGDFIFTYTSFVSTIAGLLVCYMFVVYLIQIGFRSVKLAFLQLIAPIPIISYVDPKTSEKTYKAWIKECTSTYFDVFVRLIIIYFVVLLISLMTQDGILNMYQAGSDTKVQQSFFAGAFVIIGLLMFAMEAPKLVPQMLGLSSNGNFSLNPFKALGGGAGLIGMGLGAAAGGALGAFGAFSASRAVGKGAFGSIGHALTGGAASAFRGGKAGFGSKGLVSSLSSGMGKAGVSSNRIYQSKGTTLGGRTLARVQQAAGLQTKGQRLEAQVKSYNDLNGHISKLKGAAQKKMNKAPSKYTIKGDQIKYTDILGETHTVDHDINIASQRSLVETLQNLDTSGMSAAALEAHQDRLTEAKSILSAAEDAQTKMIMEELAVDFNAGRLSDVDDSDAVAALSGIRDSVNDEPQWYENLADENGNKINFEDAHDLVYKAGKAVGTEASTIVASKEYKKATANTDYAKNGNK